MTLNGLRIKTVTRALYKVFRPNVQSQLLCYTRVSDFGPHMDSIFRGRLIRESDLYASIYGTSYSAIVLRNLSVCDVRALCRWYFTFRHFAG